MAPDNAALFLEMGWGKEVKDKPKADKPVPENKAAKPAPKKKPAKIEKVE